MNRWIALRPCEAIECSDFFLVTRTINKEKIDITKGYYGWNFNANKVLAYMPIKDALECPDGWLSEYRGDNAPEKKGWYLVTLQYEPYPKSKKARLTIAVDELFFDKRWLGVPDGSEVVAYRPLPKPFKKQTFPNNPV